VSRALLPRLASVSLVVAGVASVLLAAFLSGVR
jgi:hypothetical protein